MGVTGGKILGLVPELTTARTSVHRYVIDVNRDPKRKSLYPGQNTTMLCPCTDSEGVPSFQKYLEPDPKEMARRRDLLHAA